MATSQKAPREYGKRIIQSGGLCSECGQSIAKFLIDMGIYAHLLCGWNNGMCGHDYPKERGGRKACPDCRAEMRIHLEEYRKTNPEAFQDPSQEPVGSIDNPAPRYVGKNAPDTSRLALANLPAQGTKRRITYDLIREAGARGLCDHEIEAKTGWVHQSASAVRNALMNDGHVKDGGYRRDTPQGHRAIAWVVVGAPPPELPTADEVERV